MEARSSGRRSRRCQSKVNYGCSDDMACNRRSRLPHCKSRRYVNHTFRWQYLHCQLGSHVHGQQLPSIENIAGEGLLRPSPVSVLYARRACCTLGQRGLPGLPFDRRKQADWDACPSKAEPLPPGPPHSRERPLARCSPPRPLARALSAARGATGLHRGRCEEERNDAVPEVCRRWDRS